MSLTLAGLIVRPVGWVFAGSMVQLPSSPPVSVYLKTLSALLLSSTTQNEAPSVTIPLGVESPLASPKLLAALWLPERRLAAPVYLKTLSLLGLLTRTQTSAP